MKKTYKLLIVFTTFTLIFSFSVYCTKTEEPEAVADEEVAADEPLIAFTSNCDGNYQIYVMNSDGSKQINLSNNDFSESYSSWLPDGKK